MTLTGQDIAEAQGVLASMLSEFLEPHGISINEFITMRVIMFRGKEMTPEQLREFLATQRQLGLDKAGVDELFAGMERKGWVSNGSLTPEGLETFQRLSVSVGGLNTRVFEGFDTHDLEVSHGVIRKLIERASVLRAELTSQASG